jgi:hypothetical protein
MTFVTGDKLLIARLNKYKKTVDARIKQNMKNGAGQIMALSLTKTPEKTGELRDRAYFEGPVKSVDGYAVEVGYEKLAHIKEENRYAVPVHERTEVHHKIGQAKFLEDAVNEFEDEWKDLMSDAHKKSMGGI